MQLNECAREAGVTVDALRHYLRVGLVKPEGRAHNGYRTFSRRTVARLRFVRAALQLGFGLKDVAELVKMSERGQSPCPRARSILLLRIEHQRQRLDEVTLLYRRMKAALRDWQDRPDGVPDGHSVCGLIEGSPVRPRRAPASRPRKRDA